MDNKSKEISLRVAAGESGERLDKFLTGRLPGASRSSVQHLIEQGAVSVDGRLRKANHRVSEGDLILARMPAPEPAEARGENIPLTVIYEDDALLVVNKPAGMVVHPAAGHTGGTLVNAVLYRSPEIVVRNAERPGIVHRLDRDTSGLILIAKNDAALYGLQRQFAAREVHKTYLALVEGRVEVAQGKIDAPLDRDPHDRKKIAVVTTGRSRGAVTVFRVAERMRDFTLLKVQPETGRTHQIRVHLAFIRHPVAGDPTYGSRKNRLGLQRQFLHAWQLAFAHPMTGQPVEFQAPLPPDLIDALERAGGDPAPWM
ncbi:MAG: RluA family pseudouridine synthase [Rudaea sp.]